MCPSVGTSWKMYFSPPTIFNNVEKYLYWDVLAARNQSLAYIGYQDVLSLA